MRLLLAVLVLASIVSVESLKCYVCNSIIQRDCRENFQKFGYACVNRVVGNPEQTLRPIGCRVTNQYAQGENSVIRECAYLGEDIDGKSQKGSIGTGRKYRQCSTDLCNSSNSKFFLLPIIAFISYLMY